jgi:hypothetical protein
MLLIEHYVSQSPIHGLGVFTSLFVPRGALVWQFNPLIDRIIHETALIELPQHVVQLIRTHAEYIQQSGYYILGADGDYYMNHSDEPTLVDNKTTMFAARDLRPGDELTCDYKLVTVASFDPSAAISGSTVVQYDNFHERTLRRLPPTRSIKNTG